MAYMMYDDKEKYVKDIDDLFRKCDIFALDKILQIILRNLYPKHF